MFKICNHDNFAVIWNIFNSPKCPVCHKDQQEKPNVCHRMGCMKNICHRMGCMKMGVTWDTDDTGLRYWMCDDHKKKSIIQTINSVVEGGK